MNARHDADLSRCFWLLTLMPYTSLYGAVRIKSILDDLLRDAHQHQNDLFDRLVKYLKKGRSSSNGIVFSVSYYCIPFHGSIRLLRNIRNRSSRQNNKLKGRNGINVLLDKVIMINNDFRLRDGVNSMRPTHFQQEPQCDANNYQHPQNEKQRKQ